MKLRPSRPALLLGLVWLVICPAIVLAGSKRKHEAETIPASIHCISPGKVVLPESLIQSVYSDLAQQEEENTASSKSTIKQWLSILYVKILDSDSVDPTQANLEEYQIPKPTRSDRSLSLSVQTVNEYQITARGFCDDFFRSFLASTEGRSATFCPRDVGPDGVVLHRCAQTETETEWFFGDDERALGYLAAYRDFFKLNKAFPGKEDDEITAYAFCSKYYMMCQPDPQYQTASAKSTSEEKTLLEFRVPNNKKMHHVIPCAPTGYDMAGSAQATCQFSKQGTVAQHPFCNDAFWENGWFLPSMYPKKGGIGMENFVYCYKMHPPAPTNWAVLVSATPAAVNGDIGGMSSSEMDVIALYHQLLKNGYPPEKIIVMIWGDLNNWMTVNSHSIPARVTEKKLDDGEGFESVPNTEMTPIPIDYSGDFVTKRILAAVLTGRTIKKCTDILSTRPVVGGDPTGHCSGKTLGSTKKDKVLVYLSTHAGQHNFDWMNIKAAGLLFGDLDLFKRTFSQFSVWNGHLSIIEMFMAETELKDIMIEAKRRGKFDKMAFYLHACHAKQVVEKYDSLWKQLGVYFGVASNHGAATQFLEFKTAKEEMDSKKMTPIRVGSLFGVSLFESLLKLSPFANSLGDMFRHLTTLTSLFPQKMDGRTVVKSTADQLGSDDVANLKVVDFWYYPTHRFSTVDFERSQIEYRVSNQLCLVSKLVRGLLTGENDELKNAMAKSDMNRQMENLQTKFIPDIWTNFKERMRAEKNVIHSDEDWINWVKSADEKLKLPPYTDEHVDFYFARDTDRARELIKQISEDIKGLDYSKLYVSELELEPTVTTSHHLGALCHDIASLKYPLPPSWTGDNKPVRFFRLFSRDICHCIGFGQSHYSRQKSFVELLGGAVDNVKALALMIVDRAQTSQFLSKSVGVVHWISKNLEKCEAKNGVNKPDRDTPVHEKCRQVGQNLFNACCAHLNEAAKLADANASIKKGYKEFLKDEDMTKHSPLKFPLVDLTDSQQVSAKEICTNLRALYKDGKPMTCGYSPRNVNLAVHNAVSNILEAQTSGELRQGTAPSEASLMSSAGSHAGITQRNEFAVENRMAQQVEMTVVKENISPSAGGAATLRGRRYVEETENLPEAIVISDRTQQNLPSAFHHSSFDDEDDSKKETIELMPLARRVPASFRVRHSLGVIPPAIPEDRPVNDPRHIDITDTREDLDRAVSRPEPLSELPEEEEEEEEGHGQNDDDDSSETSALNDDDSDDEGSVSTVVHENMYNVLADSSEEEDDGASVDSRNN